MTSQEDRRAYIRVDFSAPVVLRWRARPAEVTGKTVNVSVRGALISCDDINELEPGAKLDIRLVWEPDPGKGPRWLCGSGRVIWMKPSQELGREAEANSAKAAPRAASAGQVEAAALLGLNFDGPLHFENFKV